MQSEKKTPKIRYETLWKISGIIFSVRKKRTFHKAFVVFVFKFKLQLIEILL